MRIMSVAARLVSCRRHLLAPEIPREEDLSTRRTSDLGIHVVVTVVTGPA
jgi:hypothetical protein